MRWQAGVVMYRRGNFDENMQAFFTLASAAFPQDEFFVYMAALASAVFA